jgi:MFS family permease
MTNLIEKNGDLRARKSPKTKKDESLNGQLIDNQADTSDSTKTNPIVFVVFLSLILDLLAFTMILPLLPSMLEYYRINDKYGLYFQLSNSVQYFQEMVGAPAKFNSVLFGGALGSMFSFLQFVVSPIVGSVSDVYGRKPILLMCGVGIACSYVLWAFSSSFALFVLARFLGGLSKGNISLSMAIITDVSNKQNRGKGMVSYQLYSNKNNSGW